MTIYGLLVGINDYPTGVGKLNGCLNDVDNFQAYLSQNFDKSNLAIEVLKDSGATRENIIQQFRSHLGKAKEGDVAIFQYSGHGARWAAAKEFHKFYPDGKDEGLICIDSRLPGGYDLADKELAVLISEVARNNPHLAIILDCCHSGSGTRDVDAFRGLKPRIAHEVTTERPLESYLDGYYAKLKQQGREQWFSIPASKHILLTACERNQKALESDKSGIFTSTLIEVLNKSGGDISYADLFVRCRSAVRKYADNQNPQFEANGNFPAFSGFLGRETYEKPRSYSVYFENSKWKINAGAFEGFPTEPQKSVGLVLYREDNQSRVEGNASVAVVGPYESNLQLDFEPDPDVRYRAEVTSLPVPPILIYFEGDEKHKDFLQGELEKDKTVNATLTNVAEGTQYSLCIENEELLLKQREMDLLIQGAAITSKSSDKNTALQESAALMLPILRRVVRWEKSWALQNHSTKLNTSLIDFVFAEQLQDGKCHEYPAGEIILDSIKSGEKWERITGEFKVRNRTQQTLYIIFAYFSNAYGIEVFSNEPIPPGEDYVTLSAFEGRPKVGFWVDDPANEVTERFKLIVSTEKVDDFLLDQKDLKIGERGARGGEKGTGAAEPIEKYENDWFTKNFQIKIVRQLDQVGDQDAKLAQGKIVVKGHSSFKANLSLSAVKSLTRSAEEGTDFYKAFEQQGMDILNFAGTRGNDESILELTNIQNAEALKNNPLEIQVNMPLKEDEGILPLVFDGQHVLLSGDSYKDEDGNTHISIDHIPDISDHRRSIGGSLKLYFLKTYLKRNNINLLRWIDYKPDGTFKYQESEVADKVSAAKNILLLIHGITGDTESLVKGVRDCELNQEFDLVLTYDYENLNTPIEKTAQELKDQLVAAGLDKNDNKRLTLLVHSMGGLVSRWFIEQLSGNKVVDHLVMCGTPNNGSPFGKVDSARNILNMLTGLAINYIPAFVPYSGALLLLLNRSKKLTRTLEQMDPESKFIQDLNRSDDPGIPYTILAGDVDKYHEPSDQFFAQMLAKTGQSFIFDALFANQANDIAVGVESILGVGGQRSIAPIFKNLACHHMNYFMSEAGQKALKEEVKW